MNRNAQSGRLARAAGPETDRSIGRCGWSNRPPYVAGAPTPARRLPLGTPNGTNLVPVQGRPLAGQWGEDGGQYQAPCYGKKNANDSQNFG